MTPDQPRSHHHNADADDPEVVPSHWREGGPITLASDSPVLAGADQVADVDIDDTIKATYGYAKQDAGYGYSGVTGLNALIATVSTPIAAPVIVATRLSKGAANSARGARPADRRRPYYRQGRRRRRLSIGRVRSSVSGAPVGGSLSPDS